MSKKEFPDYTIGIDLGTNSVGWAAINDDYKLLRLCGKDAWGALLADSAESAESRRLMRCARRRYARRRERIKLLRELFAPLIAPIDENFFIRLDESSLRVGDGEFFRKNHYNIFDGDYTDRDYFRGENTRTVYHLRKMLAETDEKADIRLVYLAVHHMVKYRGHFLLEGRAFSKEGNMLSEVMSDLFDLLGDTYGRQIAYGAVAEEFLAVLQNKSVSEDWRVDGRLCVSRSLGDFWCCDGMYDDPDVSVKELHNDACAIVLGCDGLWDYIDPGVVANVVRGIHDPVRAAKLIQDYAFACGSHDSISVIVISIALPQPITEQ